MGIKNTTPIPYYLCMTGRGWSSPGLGGAVGGTAGGRCSLGGTDQREGPVMSIMPREIAGKTGYPSGLSPSGRATKSCKTRHANQHAANRRFTNKTIGSFSIDLNGV
jgi:hypothetical protein